MLLPVVPDQLSGQYQQIPARSSLMKRTLIATVPSRQLVQPHPAPQPNHLPWEDLGHRLIVKPWYAAQRLASAYIAAHMEGKWSNARAKTSLRWRFLAPSSLSAATALRD